MLPRGDIGGCLHQNGGSAPHPGTLLWTVGPDLSVWKQEAHAIRVEGNTHGLKASQLKRLERLGRRRLAPERLVSQELARELTELSRETSRQVGVLVDRGGSVSHVMVGSATSIEMPDWGRMRAAASTARA